MGLITLIKKAGVIIARRRAINFVEGTNVTLTITDDPVNNDIDITIAATGGSGSGDLVSTNNLSDVANVATARTNLGLDTTANQSSSTNKNYVTDAEKIVIGNTSGTNTGDNAVNSLYSGLAGSKQDTLVSATNIKTINGSSILGSGDLTVTGGLTQQQIEGLI